MSLGSNRWLQPHVYSLDNPELAGTSQGNLLEEKSISYSLHYMDKFRNQAIDFQ